ncbi:MAG: YqgE/AlgH family protein [Halopseudomonas sp.]
MTESLADINLCDHFLLSMPHLRDGNFEQTLTYICEHSDQGAMGLVINRPMELSFQQILHSLDLDIDPVHDASRSIYAGGPVQVERGFILHSPTEQSWSSSYAINEQLNLTTSVDILRAIAEGQGPKDFLITLGYAGWGAGQLEQEILHNSWLSCPADLDILFATEPHQRLEAAATKLGVNLDLLTSQSGHA